MGGASPRTERPLEVVTDVGGGVVEMVALSLSDEALAPQLKPWVVKALQ